MLKIQDLAPTEQATLKDHYRHCQTPLIRDRAHAALLSAAGRSAADIADILMRDTDTVYAWIKAFRELHLASLFPGYRDNQNAAKLTRQQKAEVQQHLSQPDGLPAAFWTLPRFQEYIQARFDVVYESARSYHYLLAYCGFSYKLPTPFNRRRDPEAAQRRLDEIHGELAPYWGRDDVVILAADETRVTLVTEIRRAWIKAGAKTILKTHSERRNQSYFGALNLQTGRVYLQRQAWQDQDETIRALGALLGQYPDQKIILLWDNALWHTGQALRALLGPGRPWARLHLIHFPPYSPDCNPQEWVWKSAKDRLGNLTPDDLDDILATFEGVITGKTFDYHLPKFVLR